MICMLIEVHVKPSALDEFLKVIKHDAVHSEGDEPGCLRFDVLRDNDDPLKFYFYEVYQDEAARLAIGRCRTLPNGEVHGARLDREIVRHATTNFHRQMRNGGRRLNLAEH